MALPPDDALCNYDADRTYIESLPREVLGHVLQKVPWASKILDCQLVSKEWYRLLKDPIVKGLWGELIVQVNVPTPSVLWGERRLEEFEGWLRQRARGMVSILWSILVELLFRLTRNKHGSIVKQVSAACT